MTPAVLPGVPWLQPGWMAAATAWIRCQLGQQAIALAGPVTQVHVRPWSTVLRVPTDKGDFYFKATAPVLADEASLTSALSGWRPDCLPRILAVDRERGWLLMPDFGVPVRSLIGAGRDLNHWRRLMPLYAAVQIEVAAHLEELLALGAMDRRLSVMPSQFEHLLADGDAMRIGRSDGLTAAAHAQLVAYRPQFAELCRQLAGYRIPETVDHGDFHDRNVFVKDGRYVIADWGDSCASHPFTTLVVTLRALAQSFGFDAGGRELRELRDLYLEPWTRFEPRERLLSAFPLAQQVGMVSRALTWYRVLCSAEGALREKYAEAVPRWLKSVLDAIPAG